jgi:hypothetical protein
MAMNREEAWREYEQLRDAPLQHSKPVLHVHPLLNAVYEPGLGPHPIIEAHPTYRRLLEEMLPSDWLYVLGGTLAMGLSGRSSSSPSSRAALLGCSLAFPGLLAVAMCNSYARLVGLKGLDSI